MSDMIRRPEWDRGRYAYLDAIANGCDEETACKAAIESIQRAAKNESQPYVDMLITIEARRPPRPITMFLAAQQQGDDDAG